MKFEPPTGETASKEEWITKLTALPWEQDQDIEKFAKGEIELLQISWTELQNAKAQLGEYKIWHPSEKTPFFLDFIALSKNSAQISKAHAVIDQILDKEVYPDLVNKDSSAAVMDLQNQWKAKSATHFRELPLTRMRPLMNKGYDVTDLDRAKNQIFNHTLSTEKN